MGHSLLSDSSDGGAAQAGTLDWQSRLLGKVRDIMVGACTRCVHVVRENCPIQQWLESRLRTHHIRARWFATAHECLEALRKRSSGPLVIGLDGKLEPGLQLLTQWNQMYPRMLSVAVVNRGDVGTAVRAIKAGAHECVERPLDEKWWLATLDAILNEQPIDHSYPDGVLTEMEKLVLSQVVEGKTSKEIAEVLRRSPRTVEVHRTHIMRKLGVSSTVDLVRQTVMMKILDPAQHS